MTRMIFYASCVLLSITLAGKMALARDLPTVQVTARASYADLDLDTPAGAETLLRRLDRAAAEACALPYSPVFPRAASESRRCRGEVREKAIRRLQSPSATTSAAGTKGS